VHEMQASANQFYASKEYGRLSCKAGKDGCMLEELPYAQFFDECHSTRLKSSVSSVLSFFTISGRFCV